MSKTIEHAGIVYELHQDYASILIVQKSACSGCHAKAACTASDQQEKIVEVPLNGENLEKGQSVILVGTTTMGWKAIAYAFFIPFVLLMTILIAGTEFTQNEVLSGLAALCILIPYYLILYLFRKRMKKKFTFYLKTH